MDHPRLSLRRALRADAHARPVIALVGGGGKSSALFRLGRDFAEAGQRVVLTTTTRIFAAQRSLAPAHLPVDQLDGLGNLLTDHGQVLVTGPLDGSGKALGLSLEMVAALLARDDVDAIVIEADGSRMRPFKAPADHEPVVPPETTHLVPIVGAEVVGQPLDGSVVHRPERVAALAGLPIGGVLTPEAVATVLLHSEGGLRGRPPGARVVPLVNKAERNPSGAQGLADALLSHGAVDELIVGSLAPATGVPSLEVVGRTAGVILAAGQGSRFGATKQLQPWGQTTLVAHAAETALAAGLAPVLIIVGHEAEAVAQAVAHLPVEIIPNPAYLDGQATSVRAGAEALLARPPGEALPNGALFLLADQPLITPTILARLQAAHRATLAPIIVPTHAGQRGNPVLFDRALWPEMLTLSGDTGGRALFQTHRAALVTVEFESPAILADVDTPEAYARLRGQA